jgi:L-rhamnose mutarotase
MKALKQYCLTLYLQQDGELIRLYDEFHQPGNVWPEVIAGIRRSGIEDMQIYRCGTQLIMVISVNDTFSFARKIEMDSNDPKIMEWEHLMERFQLAGGMQDTGSKWQTVKNVFDLAQHGLELHLTG